MSGFSDMMMDDGYSDPMEYMDMLESDYLGSLDIGDDDFDEMENYDEMDE